MRVTALVENTSLRKELGSEHGLSLYIETKRHKILFDSGATDLFAKNAEILGVDLSGADIAFLSHAHYDHGGGLKTFLRINDRAKIYAGQTAFSGYYANETDKPKRYIGLDPALSDSGRFVFVSDRLKADEELELFSGVKCLRLNPTGNADILKADGNDLVRDDFAHEVNLVIRENEKTVMITGCAHCGIVNILEHLQREAGIVPDVVIGGFHLSNPARGGSERTEIVGEIAAFLLGRETRYYTCHCTGMESYNRLKAAMGDKIDYLSGGRTLEL